MGSASSVLFPKSRDGGLQAPPGYVTPKFPGLYTPTFDLDAQNVTAVEGKFLFYAEDVWHFTLYWFIIIHAAIFILPALWFTLVSLFSRTSSLTLRRSPIRKFERRGWKDDMVRIPKEKTRDSRDDRNPPSNISKTSGSEELANSSSTNPLDVDHHPDRRTSWAEFNPASAIHRSTSHLRRSLSITNTSHHQSPPQASPPLYLAFLPFISLMVWSQVSAVIVGTVIGFTLSAVFTTADFKMSTWIPLLWALIEGSIVVISTYSTVTSIL